MLQWGAVLNRVLAGYRLLPRSQHAVRAEGAIAVQVVVGAPPVARRAVTTLLALAALAAPAVLGGGGGGVVVLVVHAVGAT